MAATQPNNSEMPFLDHLEELRWRILKSLLGLIIAWVVSFWICTNFDVFAILEAPIRPYLHGKPLYVTHVVEKFTILMQISIGLAIVLAGPVIGYQLWAFLSPALTPRERRMIIPVLIGASALFLLGVALAVFLFLPVTMKLMDGIQTTALDTLYSAQEYYGFLVTLSLAFGAVFELPILILALTWIGILSPSTLVKYRRHAIVVCLIVCEIITPGDLIISTLMLFVPVYGLYELSIIMSWFVYRARRKQREREEAIEAGATA